MCVCVARAGWVSIVKVACDAAGPVAAAGLLLPLLLLLEVCVGRRRFAHFIYRYESGVNVQTDQSAVLY